MCLHLPALEPLVHIAPLNIQKYILAQFAKILPNDVEARRSFVESGGLQKIEELNETSGHKLTEYIMTINNW